MSLENNRFHVLAIDDEEEKQESVYSLINGKQRINKPDLNFYAMENVELTSKISFFGSCFYCKYKSHSLKTCPLVLCKNCDTFGHCESICNK